MGLQAKKRHPQEVPMRSGTHRAGLWAAPRVPLFSPMPISQVPEDGLTQQAGVTGRPTGNALPLSQPAGPVPMVAGTKTRSLLF